MPSQSAKPALHDAITQALELQPAVALAKLQTVPQEPQLIALVVVLISQPSAAFVLQFAEPLLQMIEHPPLEHSGVPLLAPQTVEQVPQFAMSFLKFVSQPLVTLLSQLPQPVSQAMPHPPEVHDAVPLVLLQTFGHAPQCARSLFRSASQPSPAKLLQFAHPAKHVVMAQALPEQDDVAWLVLHPRPQPPQFDVFELVLVSQPLTKLLSQSPIGAVQAMPQVPLLHDGLPPDTLHAFAQVPQWVASFLRLTSQPFATFPSQSAKFAAQLIWHAPAVQDAVPLLVLQAAEQAPQLPTLVLVFVSQPFPTLLSQFPYPALHATPQCPALQLAVPFVPLQAVLQAPQFVALVSVLVSQPLMALLSQFSYPAVHAIPHCPPLQLAVPFVPLHDVAQVPQLVAFVLVFVSQPLERAPSQFPYPPLHTIPHCPPLQVGVPLVALHAVEQFPHLPAFVLVFVSQPFARLPSQLPYPPLHAIPHTPPLHVAVPLVPLHTVEHVPQRLGVV